MFLENKKNLVNYTVQELDECVKSMLNSIK